MLIDTHAHLDDARYEADREAMIARAREAGVESMITIGCDPTPPADRRSRSPTSTPSSMRRSVCIPTKSNTWRTDWYDEFRTAGARQARWWPTARSASITITTTRILNCSAGGFASRLQLARELSAPGHHPHQGSAGRYHSHSEGRASLRNRRGVSLFFRRCLAGEGCDRVGILSVILRHPDLSERHHVARDCQDGSGGSAAH
jgi:hypothetical protein